MRSSLAAVALLALAACQRSPRFTQPLQLAAGKTVAPEVLNDGHDAYMQYCYACHGEKGDGRGPASPGMRPPPRDFTQGMFKFAGTPAGTLPHDEDLVALLTHGLSGTPMLPWDITQRERQAVVQYIKTFSPRWKEEAPGDRVLPDGADPWLGREKAALEEGKRLYHLQGAKMDAKGQLVQVFAGCNACHPSYLRAEELDQLARTTLGKTIELRQAPFEPAERKETEYTVDGHKLSLAAPDFLFQPVKNGTSTLALYRTIAAGIGGTAMPLWKSALKDADLWALAHYVQSLATIRGTREALERHARLAAR